jgi:hypothetical protein
MLVFVVAEGERGGYRHALPCTMGLAEAKRLRPYERTGTPSPTTDGVLGKAAPWMDAGVFTG